MGCPTTGKDTNCCGKTVTETQTKVTEYGTDYCKMPKGTLQYTGARYVPVFANPVEWSANRPYEHLTMVQHMGATYISRQAVPVGAQLPAEGEQSNDYWVFLTNWNAQIEQYRQDVERLATEIDAEEETRANADTNLEESIAEVRQIVETVRRREIVLIGDSWTDPNSVTVEDGVNWVSIWKQIHQGDIIHNFAKAGRGFLTGNPTFSQQLANAAADDSFDNENVDMIIIVGAINDWGAGYTDPTSDYAPAIRTVAQTAHRNFKNAEVYYFFASCARPLSANADQTGNWSDLLGLNTNLLRFINTTMSSSLGTDQRIYRKMKAFNITHCFTEQTFKPWGAADYMRHLSQYGHWQLYKAIEHCIETGEEPKMRFGVFNYSDDNIADFKNITMVGWYTPLEIHADLKFEVPVDLTQSAQQYIELPNSAFHVFSSETPANFVANYDDLFPPTNLSEGVPTRYNATAKGIIPITQNAFEAKMMRNKYPGNERIYAWLTTPVLFNTNTHGLYIKHASTSNNTRAGVYLASMHYDFHDRNEGGWYFV